jgi:hypothetical protein
MSGYLWFVSLPWFFNNKKGDGSMNFSPFFMSMYFYGIKSPADNDFLSSPAFLLMNSSSGESIFILKGKNMSKKYLSLLTIMSACILSSNNVLATEMWSCNAFFATLHSSSPPSCVTTCDEFYWSTGNPCSIQGQCQNKHGKYVMTKTFDLWKCPLSEDILNCYGELKCGKC